MIRGTYKPDWQRAVIAASAAVIAALIVSSLYLARVVLIPLALAVFLTFVLAPVVRFFERRWFGRTISVVVTVGFATLVFTSTVWIVGNQMASLTMTLPDYEEKIRAKAVTVRGWVGIGSTSRFETFLENLQNSIDPPEAVPAQPTTVVVESKKPAWTQYAEAFVTPAVEVLGQAAFGFILTVFMLIKKEDLRNRMLRLVGSGRVTTTTKAMDDASRRVSRFLLMQLLINTGFGLFATAGLYLIGIPYAPLWGFIATLMRYVPYISTWIGLVPPLVLAVSVTDEFWQPVAVVVLFLGFEAICNNIFEPWLFGRSLGLSEVAQLVSAGFWSFLWGPVGLILSQPLTTCLLVLGKYVPALRFLEVLLGDAPPLAPSVSYFQRLTARDQDEAARVAEAAVSADEPAAVFDEVILPALRLTRTAAEDGDLSDLEEKFILLATREITDELTEDLSVPATGNVAVERIRVLACPARDEADRVALEALARLLPSDKWEVEVSAVETLTSELVGVVEKFAPAVVCVGSLPPGGLAHTRYLCKRLRNRFPDLKIVVGRWGQLPEDEEATDPKALGADAVVATLVAARDQLGGLLPILQAQRGDPGDRPASGTSRRVGMGTA